MGKFEDLTNKQFYKLTVLYRAADYVQPSGQHKRMWHCKCECGNECDVRASDLKSGNTRSCGCFQQFSRGKAVFEDLQGKTFGRLTVLYRLPDHITTSGQRKLMWHCRCSCGNECDVYSSLLRKGLKKSCGCLNKEELKRKADERIREQTELKRKKAEAAAAKKAERLELKLKRAEELAVKKAKQEELKRQKYKDTVVKRDKLKIIKQQEDRANGKDCPGKNSLFIKYPKLLAEWDYDKNISFDPNGVMANTSKKVYWKCSKGHSWQASIGSRARGNGCPVCCNKAVLKGYNDLFTTNPELKPEWDYDRNNIDPTQITAGSGKKVYWICPLGHSYDAYISTRTSQKCGCPYCSIPAKRVLKGFNDLETKYPAIAKEWHLTKNGTLTPDGVLCGSARKVWWTCKLGHEYLQTINYKVKGGGCPYCSHQKLLPGFNDFATEHPELLEEWDYDKNTIKPNEITSQTHTKAWWKCPFGHSYQASMDSRCGNSHTGCPICVKENHTSFAEQALYYYIKKAFPDAVNSDRAAIGIELDIYIPSLKIALEYDGLNWHKNNVHELEKNTKCKEKGILLIRIREEGLCLYDDCYCIVRYNIRSESSLTDVIKTTLYDIDKINHIDVDVERDTSKIYSSYIVTRKAQNLGNTYPELSKEWHPTKNGSITAEMVSPMSNKKVWWLGKCGHEWLMSVQDRTNQNCECPICSGKRVLKGYNDLETWCKNNGMEYLLEEWAYEKNYFLPSEVSKSSDKIVYWKCRKCSHTWKIKIDSRTRMKSGCPNCNNLKASLKYSKPIKCLETGEVFSNAQKAAEVYGVTESAIKQCAQGKTKSSAGYHWEYVK
ncbi:MAG: zinc-ribbon domain-containing protein [Lachnospiraceae bacterium]|nr:zinc-ribbon domain-containing protein [Lachnospiraceae bacterium]